MAALTASRISWDFDAHKAAGKLGGDDFRTTVGERIPAPVSGRLTMAGGTASIRQADGWRTVLLELGSLVGARSRDVVAGEIIATAGAMWVHAHDLAPGARADQHSRCRWITGAQPAATGTATLTTFGDDMPEYIWTKESGVGYALLDPAYENGVIVTADPNVAVHFSYLTANINNGAGTEFDRKTFNARCAAASFLATRYRARTPITPQIDYTALAAALAPLLDGDTDEEALAQQVAAALAPQFAAVLANIDDQPTEFVVTPK